MVAAGWTEAQKRAYVLANGNFPVLSKQPVTSASAAATADPNGRLGGKPQNLRVEPTTGV